MGGDDEDKARFVDRITEWITLSTTIDIKILVVLDRRRPCRRLHLLHILSRRSSSAPSLGNISLSIGLDIPYRKGLVVLEVGFIFIFYQRYKLACECNVDA
jgi:hypothetical protein